MDCVPCLEVDSFYEPDFASKSAYDASPNSILMYEQERSDMQTTFHNANSAAFLNSCGAGLPPSFNSTDSEFELLPQYENSNLDSYFSGSLMEDIQQLAQVSESEQSGSSTVCAIKVGSEQMMTPLGMNQGELDSDATLTELNMVDLVYTPVPSPPRTLANLNTYFPPAASQNTSSLLGIRTPNVAVVPPTPALPATSAPVIKTEPRETHSESCLHKMLVSAPRRPRASPPLPATACGPERRVMQVAGQARAPPLAQQVKQESVEEKWKEIEEFIHKPESLSPQPAGSRKRKRQASEASSFTSDDEDVKPLQQFSDDDSDSDADSDFSDSPIEESLTELAKKSKQYFWQYNVQAKGPKGTRLKLNISDHDPHHPSNFEDPVFDETSTSLVGIRHGGKARKGDGNEVTPNPRKLFQIGKSLYRLNRKINSFQMSNDLPDSVRNKSRKEKNKLASRACRLKKKAQHEANKVKLTGLDCEHSELLDVIRLIWPALKERAQHRMKGVETSPTSSPPLALQLQALVKAHKKTVVAGNTTDYVNGVIAKVEDGDMTGGLNIKKLRKK